MSVQTIQPSSLETLTNMALVILLVFVAMASAYFTGRIEENKKLFIQRREEERRKNLNNVLRRLGVEDLEREDVQTRS